MLVRRQALKILRGARELLNRRARELREQAEEAFRLVECADKAELAHGEEAEAAEGEAAEEAGDAARQAAAPGMAAAQQDGGGGAGTFVVPAATAIEGAGSGRSAAGSGRSVQPGGAASGRTVQLAGGGEGGGEGEEDEEGRALLEAPPEVDAAPDPWQYGGRSGVHVLDSPEVVHQLCALLLGPAAQQQGQQQGQQQRYEFFGFHFDTVATGSAAGAAALLPKGPTVAQRRDHAAHDKQSAGLCGPAGVGRAARPTPHCVFLAVLCDVAGCFATACMCSPPASAVLAPLTAQPHLQLPTTRPDVGVRLEGVALSWRSGQAFYVPLHRRPDLLAELAPLFATSALEKATWDLRGQMAALVKVLGRSVLGVTGAGVDPGGCV